MENKTAISGTPVQNVNYNMLWLPPQSSFFQLSVAVFFVTGYSIDLGVPPNITPVAGQSTQFNATFSIINNGGGESFGIVPFPAAVNQFSTNPEQFTIVFITMTDSTTKQVSTSKVHSDDANSLTIL